MTKRRVSIDPRQIDLFTAARPVTGDASFAGIEAWVSAEVGLMLKDDSRKRGLAVPAEVTLAPPPSTRPANLWGWFDAQSDKVKAEGQRRLAVLDAVGRAEMAGVTSSAAVAIVAKEKGVGSSTIWSWRRLVDGIAEADWLPHLAPRRKGGGASICRRGSKA